MTQAVKTASNAVCIAQDASVFKILPKTSPERVSRWIVSTACSKYFNIQLLGQQLFER